MSSVGDGAPEWDDGILVLGASFAGVEVVYQLVRAFSGRPPPVTVIDRQAEHGYLPLVQERLCGVLQPAASRVSTRSFVESVPGARFVSGEIESFDPSTKTVRLAGGASFRGRFVVVALGSGFEAPHGIEGAERILSYKTEPDFEYARAAIEDALDGATSPPDFVVVGGGISGCELAGEFAALARSRPERWGAPRVHLVSASTSLVPSMGMRVSARATRALEAQGVVVSLSSRVRGVADDVVEIERGSERVQLAAKLVFWAGGVAPAGVLDALGLPRTEAGWLAVGPTLQCFADPTPTRPEVFACGDAVRVRSGAGEWPTMQRAIECIWQAKVVAKNIQTLDAEPEGYPNGIPPLRPHRLRREFFYGLSLGARSMVVYRGVGLDMPGVNHRFRRWLMRQYFARYAPLPG